jgi:SAM-dependent methyltransferase
MVRLSRQIYGKRFYARRAGIAASSAARMLQMLHYVQPYRSVVDVGCGTGSWLKEAKALGADRVLGYDGPWVPEAGHGLVLREDEFVAVDLSACLPLVDDRFDIALCLEVGEHLPLAMAATLVERLCAASDVVVFSAAVPGQGGSGHVNEQLQSWWWLHFRNHGYVCYDLFRPQLWTEPSVNVVYRQNALVYVRHSAGQDIHERWLSKAGLPLQTQFELDRIHPDLLMLRVCTLQRGLTEKVWRSVRRVWGRW